MLFAFLTIIVALLISGVAAYYSIVGLMAIFSSAKIPIAIMGCVLEIGKLIVASWTFRNWKTSPPVIKIYFVFAAFVLMMITSLGIFGFLSRAHLQQTNPTIILEQTVSELESKIQQKKIQKKRLQNSLNLLDSAFEKYVELGAVTKGLKSLEATQQQRLLIENQIKDIEDHIESLTIEKFNIENKIKISEVEVGPIRYVANLIYDDIDKNNLEDAVRFIIILLVLVFDPLAIMLIIAGNISLLQHTKINTEQMIVEIDQNGQQVTINHEKSEKINIKQSNESSDGVLIDKEKIQEMSDDVVESSKPDLLDKEKKWNVDLWKDKGFKSPQAYLSFLKKFK